MRKGFIPDVPPAFFRVNSRDPWTPKGFNAFRYTKIAEVPKSIKSNRIVSSEPAMSMFAQLAVHDHLVKQMHHLWPTHVSLDDQVKHSLYLVCDGAASIDLSDASDHVSTSLVQMVLPQLWPVLAKVRSEYARFPDGEYVPLGTFAPMGSGVCFALLTLVTLGVSLYVQGKRGFFSWYGDDGIVPVAYFDETCDLLTRCGLVVNRQKSCCTGIYRESCGREMYHDLDITPVLLRDPPVCEPASAIELICSRLEAGLFSETANQIALLSQAIRFSRWNTGLQRREVSVRKLTARQKVSSLSGWDGLNRWFTTRTQQDVRIDHRGNPRWRPQGAVTEVWTKPAWRFESCWDYPFLTHWLDTRCKTESPEKQPR
jgi:hypothetical protein